MLFTQKLIGQFRFEFNAHASSDPLYETGSGLSTGEAGFRLRYEFRPEFGLYAGYEWERAFGATRDILFAAGEEVSGGGAVVGLRAWF